MIRFILLAIFIYLVYRLTSRLFLLFKQEKPRTTHTRTKSKKKEQWVDKSRAEDAHFEEIKDK